MTAEVTREPTGGQELRHFLALRPLAAILADADNWRRATTGDPTQPEPLAMQARTLLLRVRELEATVTRVRELADDFDANGNSQPLGHPSGGAWHKAAHTLRRALDGE